jgi:hypothetical protein
MLHSVLSKLPKPLDLEGLISRAIQLLREMPPESLSTWREVSSLSVLKTPRGSYRDSASLKDAEGLFRKQCHELDWARRRKEMREAIAKHKSSVAIFVLTVLVAVSAIGLRIYTGKSGSILEFGVASALLNGSSPLNLFFANIGILP